MPDGAAAVPTQRAAPRIFAEIAGKPTKLDAMLLARLWHRPPYYLTLRAADGPGRARISTQGAYSAFLAKVAATVALLGGAPLPLASMALPARMVGWLDFQATQWRRRLWQDRWTVGLAAHSVSDIARTGVLGPIRWAVPEVELADPFAWPGTGRVLAEAIMPGGMGCIISLSPGADGHLAPDGKVLLQQPGQHFSYPCSFQHAGHIYLVPEALGAAATRLYRLGSAGDLQPVADIATGEALADPTLFRYGGLFWLAGTRPSLGWHDNLNLYFSADLAGGWQAHPANPVKIDICGARPAGAPFMADGKFLRPAQDCALDYGAAVVLQEITSLSPAHFAEQEYRRIMPPPGRYRHGLHTLSAYDGAALIDAKQRRFSPWALLRRLARRLMR